MFILHLLLGQLFRCQSGKRIHQQDHQQQNDCGSNCLVHVQCLTRAHLNTPVDYESLAKLGAIMGSGGLIVMDEEVDKQTTIIEVAGQTFSKGEVNE